MPGCRSSGCSPGLHQHGAVGRAEVGDHRRAVVGARSPGAPRGASRRSPGRARARAPGAAPRSACSAAPRGPAHQHHPVDLDRPRRGRTAAGRPAGRRVTTGGGGAPGCRGWPALRGRVPDSKVDVGLVDVVGGVRRRPLGGGLLDRGVQDGVGGVRLRGGLLAGPGGGGRRLLDAGQPDQPAADGQRLAPRRRPPRPGPHRGRRRSGSARPRWCRSSPTTSTASPSAVERAPSPARAAPPSCRARPR